jgi:hypothetical protein
VTGRRFAAALVAAAALLAVCSGQAHAATTKAASWATCADRTALFQGPYRWYDDIFNGDSGHFCIRVTRHRMLVQDVVYGQPGGVVAYPAIQYGPYYAWHDPASGLPAQLGLRADAIGTIDAYVASTGRARGEYQSDVDLWLAKNANTSVHATAEIVIVNRSSGTGSGRLTRIGGIWYRVRRWETCPAAVGMCWPLMLFVQVRQTDRARVDVSGVLAKVLAWRWLPSWEWLFSVNYGVEVWNGDLRLTLAMDVRWVPVPCICERGTS